MRTAPSISLLELHGFFGRACTCCNGLLVSGSRSTCSAKIRQATLGQPEPLPHIGDPVTGSHESEHPLTSPSGHVSDDARRQHRLCAAKLSAECPSVLRACRTKGLHLCLSVRAKFRGLEPSHITQHRLRLRERLGERGSIADRVDCALAASPVAAMR